MILWEVNKLVCLYNGPFRKVAQKLAFFRGVEIPTEVKIGCNVNFAHNAVGTVIHRKTVIEDDVIIFPGVTIGKADIFEDWQNSKVEGFIIEKGAALCAGAKVLCKEGILHIGKHAIVAANAVVNHSVGAYEIVGGCRRSYLGTIFTPSKLMD